MISIENLPEDALRHIVKYLRDNDDVKAVNHYWYRLFSNREYVKIQRSLVNRNVNELRSNARSGKLVGSYVIQINSIMKYLKDNKPWNYFEYSTVFFDLDSGMSLTLCYFQELRYGWRNGSELRGTNIIVKYCRC